jgi:hypothetical protein
MVRVACPRCGKSFSVDDRFAGKRGKCRCGAVVTIPSAATVTGEGDLSVLEEAAAQAQTAETFAVQLPPPPPAVTGSTKKKPPSSSWPGGQPSKPRRQSIFTRPIHLGSTGVVIVVVAMGVRIGMRWYDSNQERQKREQRMSEWRPPQLPTMKRTEIDRNPPRPPVDRTSVVDNVPRHDGTGGRE